MEEITSYFMRGMSICAKLGLNFLHNFHETTYKSETTYKRPTFCGRLSAPKENPGLDSTVASSTANVKPSRSWGDMVDFPLDFPLPDNLLDHYGDEEGEGEGTEDDASADFLGDEVDDDEEEDAILIQLSRPSSTLSGSTSPPVKEADIHEVCKRAAAKLGLEWPASQTSAVAGERALWLNLSSLPDQDKQVIIDSRFEPLKVKGLFGEAVTSMQQACDLRKKQGEAFNLCLPRKPTPRQQPPPCSGFAAAAAKNRTAVAKEPRGPNAEQAMSQQPRAPNQKPWGKH
ncbi:hypothetical protein SKAU_G00087300 [Synaphobranchus kaupii]|uniref:Uncharacterized protein n=1 Tax=Synaphobranchus kaupii TaxID=118154 RepID=A0A9Q1J520_SYNKA|nr:hypothetical protein SKAU_G00087300 [Synaphobranchus kaupii]